MSNGMFWGCNPVFKRIGGLKNTQNTLNEMDKDAENRLSTISQAAPFLEHRSTPKRRPP